MASHLTKLENLTNSLKCHGKAVLTKMLILKILVTILPKYAHFHSAWDLMPEDKTNLDEFKSKITVKVEEQKWRKITRMKKDYKFQKTKNKEKKKPKCFNCRKIRTFENKLLGMKRNQTEEKQLGTSS